MRFFLRFVLLLSFLAHMAWAAAQSRMNFREGLWRIDVEMVLPGRGPQANGPMFREVCLTGSNLVQMVIPDGAPCQGGISNQKPSGIDLKMSCQQGQTVTYSKGHIEFGREKLAGAVLTTAPGYSMEFKTLITGKYLGACPPGRSVMPTQPALSARPPAPAQNPPGQLPGYKP